MRGRAPVNGRGVSYRGFGRKYRPQTFDEVIGQDHITRTLQNAVAANRLAQAYLFVGPRGIGKTSTARILANLLANAVKYSPRTSEIVFGAEPDPGGVVRLWVRDQGEGIPARFHQRIFEKFGVVDQQESTRSPSTGLGLAFCKLAVEAQCGAIGVESKAGKGSTFWFTLPAAAAPETAPDR